MWKLTKSIVYKVTVAGLVAAILFEAGFILVFSGLPQRLIRRQANVAAADFTLSLELYNLDWLPPVVSVESPQRTLKYQSTEFALNSNEELIVESLPDNWKMESIAVAKENYTYLIVTPAIPDGEFKFPVNLKDKGENKVNLELKVTAPPGRVNPPAWPGSKYTVNADSLIAMANKQYRLLSSYEPKDLVALADHGIVAYNQARLRQVLIEDLKQMVAQIKAAGIDYKITSGYRSYDSQLAVYNSWLDRSRGNVAYTDSFSARPGHSEHQLGTTMDFVTIESDDTFYRFEHTALGKWLAANAHTYGFVMSYPAGKTDITGYTYEPWHFRYVGREHAAKVKASGVTLTEWLVIENLARIGAQVVN